MSVASGRKKKVSHWLVEVCGSLRIITPSHGRLHFGVCLITQAKAWLGCGCVCACVWVWVCVLDTEIATWRAQTLLIKAALRHPCNAIRSSVIDSNERKCQKQPPPPPPPLRFKVLEEMREKNGGRHGGGDDHLRSPFQNCVTSRGASGDSTGRQYRQASTPQRKVWEIAPPKNGIAIRHAGKNVTQRTRNAVLMTREIVYEEVSFSDLKMIHNQNYWICFPWYSVCRSSCTFDKASSELQKAFSPPGVLSQSTNFQPHSLLPKSAIRPLGWQIRAGLCIV